MLASNGVLSAGQHRLDHRDGARGRRAGLGRDRVIDAVVRVRTVLRRPASPEPWVIDSTGVRGIVLVPGHHRGPGRSQLQHAHRRLGDRRRHSGQQRRHHDDRHVARRALTRSFASAATQPAALSSVSASSALRIGVGDDAAADVDAQLVAGEHADADRDREIERAAGAEVAERAAVGAAPRRLELVDDLHRADLRRAGDRAAGERRAQEARRSRRPARGCARRATPGGRARAARRRSRARRRATLPVSATRPRSLRSRSTIITCSARPCRRRRARRRRPGVRGARALDRPGLDAVAAAREEALGRAREHA